MESSVFEYPQPSVPRESEQACMERKLQKLLQEKLEAETENLELHELLREATGSNKPPEAASVARNNHPSAGGSSRPAPSPARSRGDLVSSKRAVTIEASKRVVTIEESTVFSRTHHNGPEPEHDAAGLCAAPGVRSRLDARAGAGSGLEERGQNLPQRGEGTGVVLDASTVFPLALRASTQSGPMGGGDEPGWLNGHFCGLPAERRLQSVAEEAAARGGGVPLGSGQRSGASTATAVPEKEPSGTPPRARSVAGGAQVGEDPQEPAAAQGGRKNRHNPVAYAAAGALVALSLLGAVGLALAGPRATAASQGSSAGSAARPAGSEAAPAGPPHHFRATAGGAATLTPEVLAGVALAPEVLAGAAEDEDWVIR